MFKKLINLLNTYRLALNYSPKKYWTKKGSTYIKEYPPTGERLEGLIASTLKIIEFQSILDVGCGYGRYCRLFAEHFPEKKITGVDISPTLISQAKKYLQEYPGVKLQEIDGENIPYPDSSFDISFTYGCMIHVPKDKIHSFIKELSRVTSGKGLYIESSTISRPLLKRLLVPSVFYYSHNYEELFSYFRLPYQIAAEWKLSPSVVERLYIVDFSKPA